MEKIYFISIVIFCIIFLVMLGIFLSNLLDHFKYPPVADEYIYMANRINRHQTIETGSGYGAKQELKDQYNIQVNFEYFIVCGDLIYLFDCGRTLFAICDKTTKKTHMFNLKNAQKIFYKYEEQFNGCVIKPGDITILPFAPLHVC